MIFIAKNMAEYKAVRGGHLKLKGGSNLHKKRRTKRKKEPDIEEWMKEEGAVKHGVSNVIINLGC